MARLPEIEIILGHVGICWYREKRCPESSRHGDASRDDAQALELAQGAPATWRASRGAVNPWTRNPALSATAGRAAKH